MTLTLYTHPLASFCQKALIAFYENDTPFKAHFLDLGDPTVRAEFNTLWPIGKMPLLLDQARGQQVAESTIIIEYLATYYPGPTRFIPDEAELAWQTRLADRFYDNYVHVPMQKIVVDKLRPEGQGDPYGVEEARATLRTSYDMLESEMGSRFWAMGEVFTLADCAAAPALFYANEVQPFGETHPALAGYFGRLMDRPSFARVLAEAQPYFDMFPG
ncbi:glutathione S-transferase family protein [Kaistia nematophila]|uniref:Glutathione S-transferase family protein n=1 Tax=Kaistia nematophila TaxID=2994654 RepID=A0A9X3E5U0_9HYPH|nr:glutathione S-transferase family protein [Kaistia nematophila]MCX5571673.1 glutathione S-transferase family protein [Kaistia nematophila]